MSIHVSQLESAGLLVSYKQKQQQLLNNNKQQQTTKVYTLLYIFKYWQFKRGSYI